MMRAVSVDWRFSMAPGGRLWFRYHYRRIEAAIAALADVLREIAASIGAALDGVRNLLASTLWQEAWGG